MQLNVRSILAAAVLVALPAVAYAQASPNELLAARKAAMQSAGAHMAAVNAVVRGESNARALVKNHANALAGLGGAMPGLFADGTGPDKVQNTKAKAEAFTNKADFAAKAKALQDEAVKLAAAAEGTDAAALQAQFAAVGRTCGGCHTPYRAQ